MELDLNKLRIAAPEGGKGAIPLLIKANPDDPNCWATPDGRVYRDKEWAEKAIELDSREYKDASRARIEAGRLVRAEVMDGWTGWVTTCGDEDDYFSSVDELLERHGDHLAWAGVPDEEIPSSLPAWAFCTTEDTFDFDIEDAIRNYLADNHHADADDFIDDWDGLDRFWREWSAKQHVTSYLIDYKRIVVIDPARYEAELAAAKALIAEEA